MTMEKISNHTHKLLQIRDLCKSYDQEMVLDHVSMTLSYGNSYCLMAPSGSGKTTLFRILLGLESADSGQIEGLSKASMSAVFQEDRLLEGYTALENLRFVTGRRYSNKELTELLLRLLPAENSLLKLCADGLCNELSVYVGILDLDYIYYYGATNHCLELCSELLDLSAVEADYYTGLCTLDENSNARCVTLDLNSGNTCALKLSLNILSDLVVRNNVIAKLFVGYEPSGIPVLDYADSKTMRIYLLSHD